MKRLSDSLVSIFGWRVALHYGDLMVWDRWRWLNKRVRKSCADERLLDVGCGSGAFTIGLAKRGYKSLGLSWDARNRQIAIDRARNAGAQGASFEICDVRRLDDRRDLRARFDVVICMENIEHVIDDFKLMAAIAACLKPGGRLLLSSPYINRWPWSSMDYGPFPAEEDGRHVRRGYNRRMLIDLCENVGLKVEELSFISGPVSQIGSMIMNRISSKSPLLGWMLVFPLRPLPPVVDRLLASIFNVSPFCIAVEAIKPRSPASGHIIDNT